MAVAIRLARGGAKKRPYYRIVVADSRNAARRPLHREGRHLQSAAGEGFARAREARRRAHLALAVGRRPAVGPRAALPRCRRHQERAGAQQPEEGRAGREGQGARRGAREEGRRRRSSRRRAAAGGRGRSPKQVEEATAEPTAEAEAVAEEAAERLRRSRPTEPRPKSSRRRRRAAAEEPVAEEAAAEEAAEQPSRSCRRGSSGCRRGRGRSEAPAEEAPAEGADEAPADRGRAAGRSSRPRAPTMSLRRPSELAGRGASGDGGRARSRPRRRRQLR